MSLLIFTDFTTTAEYHFLSYTSAFNNNNHRTICDSTLHNRSTRFILEFKSRSQPRRPVLQS